MNTHADKKQAHKNQTSSTADAQRQNNTLSTFQFKDHRPEAVAQRKLQAMANNSPRAIQLRAIQEMANNSPQAKQAAQLQAMANHYSARQPNPIQKKENKSSVISNSVIQKNSNGQEGFLDNRSVAADPRKMLQNTLNLKDSKVSEKVLSTEIQKKSLAPSEAIVQRKLFSDIHPGAESWTTRDTLGGGIADKLSNLIHHANTSGNFQGGSLNIDGVLNWLSDRTETGHQRSQVNTLKEKVDNLFEGLASHSWNHFVGKWKEIEKKVEDLYISMEHPNTSNRVPIPVGRSTHLEVSKLKQVNEAVTGNEGWRNHGLYRGRHSRIPKTDSHYAVGPIPAPAYGRNRSSAPGAERIYTNRVRLPNTPEGGPTHGVEAYYSPTHGDANPAAKAGKEKRVFDETTLIDGEPVIAPWDPRL